MLRPLVPVLVVCMLGACGGSSKHTVNATLSGRNPVTIDPTADAEHIATFPAAGSECHADGIIDDTQIMVKDGDGNIIATTRVGTVSGLANGAGSCDFALSFSVPDAPFYAFSSDRLGDLGTFSKSELEADDWHVNLGND